MSKEKKEIKLEPIKPFNDHSNCKGHANYMLDCDYTKQEDRDCLITSVNNYISDAR